MIAPATLRRPSLATVVAGAGALWALAIGLRPLVDNSFFTHLATGRLILAHGIPRTDPYSFTAHGHPWTLESWLAEVGMALVARVAGPHGIQLVHAGLTVLIALLVWRLTRPAVSLIGRILCMVPTLAVGTMFWAERPLLVALAFLAATVIMAETEWFSWWLVVPMMWLWVNIHGSWPIALGYIAVRLLGRRLDRRPAGRLPSLVAAVAVGIAAGVVNPLGLRLLLFPFNAITRHKVFAVIVEWQHPSFTAVTTLVFLAMAVVSGVTAGRRRSIEDGLVVVAFTAAACMAERNLPVATILMAPVLARGLTGLGRVTGEIRTKVTAVGLATLVGVGALLTVGAMRGPAYNLRAYPITELAWVRSHGLLADRLATPDWVGNLLEAQMGPGRNVFIDDRVDMYPSALVFGYAELEASGPGSESVLDRYRVGAVLWQTSKPLARRLAHDPRWHVALRDSRWQLVVRSRATT